MVKEYKITASNLRFYMHSMHNIKTRNKSCDWF